MIKPVEGEQAGEYEIYELTAKTSAIDFEAEPPARAVRQMHNAIQSGDRRAAFGAMNPSAYQGGQGTFEAFIDEQGELFSRSVMDIEEVRYLNGTTSQAEVRARLSVPEGPKALVLYTLTNAQREEGGFQRWLIDGITPMIESEPERLMPAQGEDEQLDPEAPEGEQGDGEDEGVSVD